MNINIIHDVYATHQPLHSALVWSMRYD